MRTHLLFATLAAFTFACTSEVKTVSDAPAQPEEGAPAEEGGTTPDEPADPNKPADATPPTLSIDKSFAGGAGIADATHDVYASVPGPGGVVYVALRKAGGSIGWGGGTLLRRYLASGALDTSFATGGVLDTVLVANPSGLAVDAQGRVLVGGVGLYDPDKTTDSGREIVVVRVTSAGVVDTTYGTGGRAKLDYSPANTWTSSLKVRTDGGVFVAVWGRTNGKESFGGFLVDPAGGAVNGYGPKGFVSSPFPTDGAVALGVDVAVPTSSGLARFAANGAKKGLAIEAGVAMAKTDKDGAFVAVVSDGKGFGLERFTSSGEPDASFARTPLSEDFRDFVILEDGSVIVADGAALAWASPKGGKLATLAASANAGHLATTADGKLLVTTAAESAKVLRYTL